MSYMFLVFALLLEVIGTSVLKLSNGFSEISLGFLAYFLYGISIWIFSIALKHINLAVADTIWQGLGIVLVTLVSVFLFNEPISYRQLAFIIVTLIGVIGIGIS